MYVYMYMYMYMYMYVVRLTMSRKFSTDYRFRNIRK
jgi:hypothetical protein